MFQWFQCADARRSERTELGPLAVFACHLLSLVAVSCATNVSAAKSQVFIRDVEASGVKPFWIDLTEVTVREYSLCVRDGKCAVATRTTGYANYGPGYLTHADSVRESVCNYGYRERAEHPMNCVNWDMAQRYCLWRNARLPTASEWRVAACGSRRAGFAWGVSGVLQGRVCLMNSMAPMTCPVAAHPLGRTRDGVLGMSGNVSEWTSSQSCAECRDHRLIMGGSILGAFPEDGFLCSAKPRSRHRLGRHADIGFRCVVD